MKKIYYAAAALAVVSLVSCGKSEDKAAQTDSVDVEVIEGQEDVEDLGPINDSTELVGVTETVEGAEGTVPAQEVEKAAKAAQDAAAKAQKAAEKAQK